MPSWFAQGQLRFYVQMPVIQPKNFDFISVLYPELFFRYLVEKPEGRRPLGRSRRRWVDNIRKDLQEVGCGYMDWIGLA